MWDKFFTAASIDHALDLLAQYGGDARLINGGTDLMLEIERKARTPQVVIDISRVPSLDEIRFDDGVFHLGASVTHNQAVGNKMLIERAYPLARACWQIGAPQIRNRGTVAGNLITASPANDTIPPLWAMGAHITLQSKARGKREIALDEFVRGVRQTALEPDEMLTKISFPALKPNEFGTFIKLGLRRAQAISVVNAAVVLGFEQSAVSGQRSVVESAWITLGSVAPTIAVATDAQQFLIGKPLDDETIEQAARRAMNAARPIDDIRGPADYRREMTRVLVARALRQLRDGTEREDFPAQPVMLWGKTDGKFNSQPSAVSGQRSDEIETIVNGKRYTVRGADDKSLLRMLREDIGLQGTKEGCAEGECGACTVFLDGIAVMSCLVPAPRAHHAEIVTVEGLSRGDELHPVQSAFIETGAVQCGYCTPGFVMSGASLLDEKAQPTREDIQHAFTGNLCRCTGYYKIVEAIERAAQGG
ncbi:MAG: 2Fe-2S iron-sulfur cluster binding domain-containing protein [Chloroflexi bacterium]|nr:2Fe-2S iron-sulfur cluster binding domain-containing protein [Chloroflexota bacterium]